MNKITTTALSALKSTDKKQKIRVAKGLFLVVLPLPKKTKTWRFLYQFNGKRRELSLGVFPTVGLAEARKLALEAQNTLYLGIDPGASKVTLQAQSTLFKDVAMQWFNKDKNAWSNGHQERVIRQMETHLFPHIGNSDIANITPKELMGVLLKISTVGTGEIAFRCHNYCRRIWDYAIILGITQNQFVPAIAAQLPKPKTSHYGAITDKQELQLFITALASYSGSYIVKCGLQLLVLFFVRPGELRNAKWEQFDLVSRRWTYIVPKTKTPHIVPLSSQAIQILMDLKPYTKESPFVLPSPSNRNAPISDMTFLTAIRRLGFEKLTAHGFRATARTLLDEELHFPPHLIEHQLAHTVKDPLGRAYNRTTHLDDRVKMMQSWADFVYPPMFSSCE